ncbi:DUF6461 domain-containing protein [Plantactinospora sp. CA-294935]|uniref:DUF6461 domain-containing protein n=1 Tax=Plantactinospora sp. CA-294935 TaxID=3240012 RepID=UPI003D8D2457
MATILNAERFRWADDYESLCMMFVLDRAERELIAAFGGDPQLIRLYRSSEALKLLSPEYLYQPIVRVGRAGPSVFTTEVLSVEGGRTEVLRRASAGTRAVSVMRSGNAMVHFAYAEDGEVVTGFEAGTPEQRGGTDPDRLVPNLARVGLLGDRSRLGGRLATCLLLAAEVLGITFDAADFRKPLPGAPVLPLLPTPLVPETDRARAQLIGSPFVSAAVAGAADEHLWPAVRGLASRMLTMADLLGDRDLGDALHRDGNEEPSILRDDEALGMRIRVLIAEGTGAESSGEVSLRRSAGLSTEERQRRLRRRAAAMAVHAALVLPPRSAMYALLHLRQRAAWPSPPELDLSYLPEPPPSEVERQAALFGDLHSGARTRVVKAPASRPSGPRPQRR